MKKLLARYKKLQATMKKHGDLCRAAQIELAEVGQELRAEMGAKLNSLKGEAFSPLKCYKWAGRFESVYARPGMDILGLVLSAKRKKNKPDPIETFLGEAMSTITCGYAIVLQKGITLRAVNEGWEIRFSENYERDNSGYLSAAQCREYIIEHKLRATMTSSEHGDYKRAKQFIAECDEFMEMLGKEKK